MALNQISLLNYLPCVYYRMPNLAVIGEGDV